MSTRHLHIIEQMVAGSPAVIPKREVLMLPDRLQFCTNYDPCAFGTPGGAPRALGEEFPVVVAGRHTFIYVQVGGASTFVMLEDK